MAADSATRPVNADSRLLFPTLSKPATTTTSSLSDDDLRGVLGLSENVIDWLVWHQTQHKVRH